MKSDKNIREGYKRTAVGVIPKEWEVKIFEDLVTKKSQTYNSSENPNTKDIELDSIEQKTGRILNIYDSKDFKSSKYIFNKGDVLFGRLRPYLKKYWKAQFNGVCSTEIWVLKNKENITSKYLFYTIQTKRFLRYAYISSGTKMPRSDWNVVGKGKLPIPPLPEQQAIANCLTTWDSGIEKLTQLIAAKREQKKGLMQQLLTGKKRLDGFVGEWRKENAGDVFESFTLKGLKDEELLSATQDRGIIPRSMLDGRVTMPSSGTKGYKLVEEGDFVISLRSFQGGIEYSYYRGLVSPAYTVLKPKISINKEFYKHYFKSYNFIGRLSIAVIGIRDGKQISYNDFRTVKIPYISVEEQSAIAKVINTADQEISLLEAKLAAMKEEKKGLMQVLLTGEKRLIDS